MEKLTLKYLAPYLPYGLKISYVERNEIHSLDVCNLMAICNKQEHLKPIFRPLSEFVDINSDSMKELNADISTQIDLNELAIKYKHHTSCYYSTLQFCFENHIDVFGLIEKGLAIDINTLK